LFFPTVSVIFSDSWKAYCTTEIERQGFSHFKVNHRYNFVDPETGINTQKIERLWGSAKWRNKKHRGTSRHHLESYLSEFMWRRETTEPFDKILNDLKMFMPPQ
jgi:transposase-like protein